MKLLNLKCIFRYGWRVNIDALDNNFARHVALFPEQAKSLQYRGPTVFVAGGNSDYIRYNYLIYSYLLNINAIHIVEKLMSLKLRKCFQMQLFLTLKALDIGYMLINQVNL